MLAKLRSGHFLGLNAYKNCVRGDSVDLKFHLSDKGAVQDLEHWVRCPALAPLRRNLIGEDYTELDLLIRYPLETLALAMKSLPGAR